MDAALGTCIPAGDETALASLYDSLDGLAYSPHSEIAGLLGEPLGTVKDPHGDGKMRAGLASNIGVE